MERAQSLLRLAPLTSIHCSMPPGWWYFVYEQFWQIIFPTLRIHYHEGSSRRGVGLWCRSSGPGHSRSNQLWVQSVPVTLGTLTINWIINMIKESKIDELSVSLNRSRISHLLASHWAELSVESEEAANWTMDLTNLNKAVKTTKKEEINTFSSKIIHG